MLEKSGKFFERFILNSRFSIFFTVIFGLIGTFIMIILGSLNIIMAVWKLFQLFFNYSQLEKYEKVIVTNIISAVDEYLIATVLIIFSIGLYELFIRKITEDSLLRSGAKILIIDNLDQLKEKLAKVIIIVLIVTYFKYALELDYTRVIDLFILSGGIFLIALSVYFISGNKENKNESPIKKPRFRIFKN